MLVPSVPRISSRSFERLTGPKGNDSDYRTVRVEPVVGVPTKAERRFGEGSANTAALRLGIAAQMLTSHTAEAAKVLPLAPATRMAARYASVAEGPTTSSLGLSRSV